MRKSFLISTAAVALIAAAGLANAQAPNASGSQSAPATMNRGDAPDAKAKPDDAKDSVKSRAATEMNADKSKDGMKDGAKADQKSATDTKADQKMPAGTAQRAPDDAKDGVKSKAVESPPDKAGGKAATEMNTDKSKDGLKADQKTTTDTKSGTTTGQAGTAARQLNPEQRTTIRTVIKQENVKPVTNINFSISVGTTVPRSVGFHSVPRQLVTIYPDWQGYEYFLVGDQIIIVNPRTLQIVAVLEA